MSETKWHKDAYPNGNQVAEVDSEIYALLDSIDCDVEVCNGVVVVTDSNGVVWTFTEPSREMDVPQ